ncbi:hypothetical protein LCGC14_2282800, partial [marine sediment metagenome]
MPQREMDELTESVKDVARRHGAALVGVAPVERFDPMPPALDAVPKGHHPADYLPEARSVISIAMPILNPVMDAPAILADREMEMIPAHVKYAYLEQLYNRVGHVVHDCMLEFIAQMIGQHLLTQGHQAMIFPTTGLHPAVDGMTDKEIWEGPSKDPAVRHSPFRYTFGPFSHRHAATRAGLGEFGYNNLVLTKQFGPRQRFNSIVTDAELTPEPLITEPICLRDECKLCLVACIMDCVTMRDDPAVTDYRSVEKVDRTRIFIDTPAKTDPTLCRRRRDGRPTSP